jgi:hypothetical protein
MEVYSVELDLGQMKIEVSVKNTSPRITFSNNINGDFCELSFNVFLTAKDKNGRRLWRTPVTDHDGRPKVYTSVEQALAEATMRFQEEIKK